MRNTGFAIVTLSAAVSFAAPQPVVDTDEVFQASYVEDFALDGDVGKPVWGNAKAIPRIMFQGGKPLPYRDNVRVMWSKTALYIGATMWQDVSKAEFKWDQRDMPTWNDDNLELFLFVPLDNGKNGLFQFACLWLYMRVGVINGLLAAALRAS